MSELSLAAKNAKAGWGLAMTRDTRRTTRAADGRRHDTRLSQAVMSPRLSQNACRMSRFALASLRDTRGRRATGDPRFNRKETMK